VKEAPEKGERETAFNRCGIDSVEIPRMERLLLDASREELLRIFSAQELDDAGEGQGRAARLAARFAAKEACLKLFPRETALENVTATDFSVVRGNYGAPRVRCSANAAIALGRNRIARIELSLTHDRSGATAIALAVPDAIQPSLAGRILYHLLPFRREIILGNLRRVFGGRIAESEIVRLAQAHYGHLWRMIVEFLTYPLMPAAKREEIARVENLEALRRALEQGKGALVLTGHFGNFEIATAGGISRFPEARGRFYFLRRPFKPRWLENYVAKRALRAGFGTLPKNGSLDWLMQRLEAGDLVVFPFDQHAGRRDGIRVEFFGHAAGTFRSLALIAQASGAPVVPASSWREPGGTHVLRFEEALPHITCDDFSEEIRRNTRAYNKALELLVLRHPEQWWWAHRRWK